MFQGKVNFLRMFVVMGVVIFITSCNPNLKTFDLVDENYKFKPGSIAVIAGKNKDQDYKLARKITSELTKRSSFKVMSQDTISQRIRNYPYNDIVGKWGTPPPARDKGNWAWFSPANRAAVRVVQRQLGVRYVYVVWSNHLGSSTVYNSQGGSSTTYKVVVYGRLLSNPGGNVRGYTVNSYSHSDSCFTFWKTHNQEVNAMFDKTAVKIAREIIEISGFKKEEN